MQFPRIFGTATHYLHIKLSRIYLENGETILYYYQLETAGFYVCRELLTFAVEG